MAQFNFDANQHEPFESNFEPLPAGWYKVSIQKDEVKPTKGNDGTILAFTYGVLDGKFQNRKLFDNLNIKNKNAIAEKIAYQKLSAISRAVGKMQWKLTEELHNIPFWVLLKVKPAKDGYPEGNEIVKYCHISETPEGVTAAPVAASAPVIPPAAPATPKAPPVAPQPVPANDTPPAWNGAPDQPWSAPAAEQAPVASEPVKTAASEPVGGSVVEAGEVPPWMQNVTMPQ
jgi:hypothetical protein